MHRSKPGSMRNCPKFRTSGWICWARLPKEAWSIWSCRVQTTLPWHCEWPSTRLGIFRLFGRFPHQVLLYVGEPALRMESELRGPDVFFRYEAVDVRALDGERLLESSAVGDNVIAILARLRDHGDAVRKIVERIAGLPAPDREAALGQLLVLAGLRHLEESVEQEARKMPILNDILDNKVLGREFKRGVQEGELTVLRRQIEKRFGALPSWAEERLAGRTTTELEELSIRVLDAQNLEELLK